jgi:signal transduction histidine kinase/predicted transcriptional regulator
VIQQNLDISAVNEFSLLHFINQKGNLFLYIIFFVGGFSFVLSTLNQQFVALSDILKKHLTLKLRSSLLILIFASFLFSQILGTLYLSKIGTLCLLGIFQLFIPVIGGFVWEKGNSTGATASIITGTLIWLVIGWGGFLSDPSSYIDGKPLLGEYFLTSILPNQVSSNTSHYFFASFFLSIIFSFAAYILFSLKKGIREKIPPVYLGKSHHFHLDNTSFKDILSAFDYDLSLLNTLGFFYNNQNQSFMESELKEYLSTQNISAQLQNLHQRGFITRSSERGNVYYQYNAKHIHSWDLSRFFNTFYSFRQIIENMTFHLQKSKKEIKFRLNQMEQIYKIYLKIGFMRTRKDFFRTIGNYLPRIYPDIIQISYIKKRKPHVLYKTESDSSEDLFSFKINLGSAYLDLKVTKKFNINTLFILEPIIILSYRITEYIGKLKKYTQRLKNLDSIRTHFLSNISHELRTPLVPLKGYLAILKINDKVKQDPDLSEIIETMDKSYQRLESLIENLIVFKELSFDLFHLEKINLMDILFKVILELKNKIDAKSLNIDFPENQLNNIKIEGDREKIEMALIQILDNAVKFNIPEGTIQIRLKDMGENTLLTIEDSGVGMDKETEDQVFEAFFQEEADSTRRYEGTGIGLSLVKKIIVLHGGKIKIRSRKGAGTTVFIELPKKVKPY